MSQKEEKTVQSTSKTSSHERSWEKWLSEITYNLSGWQDFIRALRSYHYTHDKLPQLVNDKDLPKLSLDNYYVNLALVTNSDHEEAEKLLKLSSMAREEIYQKKLFSGAVHGVNQLFPSLHDHNVATGWTVVIGRAGTGKTTLEQYLAYEWARRKTVWYERFSFVFRVQLNLIKKMHFTASNIDNLVELIYCSFESPSPVLSRENIRACLNDRRNHNEILVLLDGFDEVKALYEERTNIYQRGVIDFAMTLPNGLLTMRPNGIPIEWLQENPPRLARQFENIGLTENNVAQYIENYFKATESRPAQPELASSLLTALSTHPEMMSLAQIPINAAILCLTWEEEQKKIAKSESASPIFTITKLYTRLLEWLVRRYYNNFQKELQATHHLQKAAPKELFQYCQNELDKISYLAYKAFVDNEVQTIDHELLQTYIPERAMLDRISQEFGVLRAAHLSREDEIVGQYEPHYFIHLTYQEFFAALYIAEQLKTEPSTDCTREIARRVSIQKLAKHIAKERHNPRYEIIWTFLAGLVSMPEYAAGANYFWDAILDFPSSNHFGSMKNRVGNEGQGYVRHSVLGDGDCGYTALGITRQDATQLLLNNIRNISNLIRIPVRSALITKEFYQYLANQNIINVTHNQLLENEALLTRYESDLAVQSAYIQYDVRDRRIDAGYSHPAVLQALAHIQHIELHMWRLGGDNVLLPHIVHEENYAAYIPPRVDSRVDLLFVNGNHFDRLEIQGYGNNIPSEGIYPLDSSWNHHFEEESFSIIIGLHPHVIILQSQQRLCREALLISLTFKEISLPHRLEKLLLHLRAFFIWDNARDIKELISDFDESNLFLNNEVMAPSKYHQNKQRFQHDMYVFGFQIEQLSIFLILNQMPSWKSDLMKIKKHIETGDEYSLGSAEELGKLGIVDDNLFVTFQNALKIKDHSTGYNAIKILAKFFSFDKRLNFLLRESLKDDNFLIRGEAAQALIKVNADDVEAIATIINMLKETDENYNKHEYALKVIKDNPSSFSNTETVEVIHEAIIRQSSFHVPGISAAETLHKIKPNDSAALIVFRRMVCAPGYFPWDKSILCAKALLKIDRADAQSLTILRLALTASQNHTLTNPNAYYSGTFPFITLSAYAISPWEREQAAKALDEIAIINSKWAAALNQAFRYNFSDSSNFYTSSEIFSILMKHKILDHESLALIRTQFQKGEIYKKKLSAKYLLKINSHDVETLNILLSSFTFLERVALKIFPIDIEELSSLCNELKKSKDFDYRFSVFKLLQKVSIKFHNKEIILALLEGENKFHSIKTQYAVNVALFRIPPYAYAACYSELPELYSNLTAQLAFVISIWLNNSIVIIEENKIIVDGKIFILSGTKEQQHIFVKSLHFHQENLIQATGLADVMRILMQPIISPSITQVFSDDFFDIDLPEPVDSEPRLKAVEEELKVVKANGHDTRVCVETLTQRVTEIEKWKLGLEHVLALIQEQIQLLSEQQEQMRSWLKNNISGLQDAISFIYCILEKMEEQIIHIENSEQRTITSLAALRATVTQQAKVIELLKATQSLQQQDTTFSEKQALYVEKFEKTITSIYIASMMISTGLFSANASSNLSKTGSILKFFGSITPFAGSGLKILAALLNTADQTMLEVRMKRLLSLGSLLDVIALSRKLAIKLIGCLDLINPVSDIMIDRLLSTCADIADTLTNNTLLGTLTQLAETKLMNTLIKLFIKDKDDPIEVRAEQDANMLIARISKNGVPTRPFESQLLLYAAPLLAIADQVFMRILAFFCVAEQCEQSTLTWKGTKQQEFYKSITNVFDDHAPQVEEYLIDNRKRERLILDIAKQYSTSTYLAKPSWSTAPVQATGLFYFIKPNKQYAHIYKEGLTREFAEEILSKVEFR